ncbi:hypothetical protein ACFCW2_00760 [Qipengyuania sp. DSG2-2]|uniref:hypothetical protein n=1 Tax=Qipengyuania sp. DGS2-2 TaxID=3349631 RepID=UPI0036D2B8E7
MTSISKLTVAAFTAAALIGSSSAPAFASAGTKAAVVCQGGLQGCVLPVGNAAPPAPTPPAATPAPAPAPAPAPVAASTGTNWLLPALLGLAAIIGGIFILDGGDDDDPISL